MSLKSRSPFCCAPVRAGLRGMCGRDFRGRLQFPVPPDRPRRRAPRFPPVRSAYGGLSVPGAAGAASAKAACRAGATREVLLSSCAKARQRPAISLSWSGSIKGDASAGGRDAFHSVPLPRQVSEGQGPGWNRSLPERGFPGGAGSGSRRGGAAPFRGGAQPAGFPAPRFRVVWVW